MSCCPRTQTAVQYFRSGRLLADYLSPRAAYEKALLRLQRLVTVFGEENIGAVDYAGVRASGLRLEDVLLRAAQLPKVDLKTPADFANPEVSVKEINARRLWTEFSRYMKRTRRCSLVWPEAPEHVSFSSLLGGVEMLRHCPSKCFDLSALDDVSFEFDRQARQILGGSMLLCANATATARSIVALNDTFCELDGARMRTDAWSSRLDELTEFLPEGACRNSSLDEHYSPIFGEGLEARAPPGGCDGPRQPDGSCRRVDAAQDDAPAKKARLDPASLLRTLLALPGLGAANQQRVRALFRQVEVG